MEEMVFVGEMQKEECYLNFEMKMKCACVWVSVAKHKVLEKGEEKSKIQSGECWSGRELNPHLLHDSLAPNQLG